MSSALEEATRAFAVAMDETTAEAASRALAIVDEAAVEPEEIGRLGLLASGLEQLLQSFDEPTTSAKAINLATDPRDEAERRLTEALSELFAELQPDVAARLAKGEMPSDEELQQAFARVIQPQLVEAAVEEFTRLGVEVGVQFDPAMVNQAMTEWARSYTFDLVKGLTDTTRKTLQDAMTQFTTTPGMTRGQLEALLEPALGKQRAESVTVTEVTRAYSAAQSRYQQELGAAGITMQKVWITSNDEIARRCPICWPKHKKPEADWKEQFPSGPPGHVRCRCHTVLQSVE